MNLKKLALALLACTFLMQPTKTNCDFGPGYGVLVCAIGAIYEGIAIGCAGAAVGLGFGIAAVVKHKKQKRADRAKIGKTSIKHRNNKAAKKRPHQKFKKMKYKSLSTDLEQSASIA